MNNRRYSADLFSEGRKYLNDWDAKMEDYAQKRRMNSRRLLRRGYVLLKWAKSALYSSKSSSGTKQALTLDEEMEKMRLEKSKRRSSLKPTRSKPQEESVHQTAIKQLMSENKELLARCDETLKQQVDLALETESDQLSAARDELDKTLERGRKLLDEMDDGALTENEELHEIRFVFQYSKST